MAYFSLHNIHSMPRSNGFFIGATYEQLLTRTLPPVIAGWEKLGYKMGLHFWVCKFPPEKWKVPRAYKTPLRADHYITWYNGSGIYLVSQDRPGTINGVETQWGGGDEAKFLNYEKLKEEALLTLSGQADKFSHLSNYLSMLLMSDMPTTSKGKWLLDFKDQMDEQTIQLIIACQLELLKLQKKLDTSTKPSQVIGEIKKLQKDLHSLRKDTVYVSYASTFDNIHSLGMEPLKMFKRTLTEFVFRVSVCNDEILRIENSFYSSLDEDLHGDVMVNYAHVDSLEIDYRTPALKDCRWDSDINLSMPLALAADYNNAINCCVTGQKILQRVRFLSSMYVLNPEMIDALIDKWHQYYQYHPVKTVKYFYDSTAEWGTYKSNMTAAQEWKQGLEKRGWRVIMIDIGHPPEHQEKHILWVKILKRLDPRLPVFIFNRENCKDWQLSCQLAGVIETAKGIKKDKGPEKKPDQYAPQEATHLSDAGDTLLWGLVKDLVNDNRVFHEIVAL